VASGACEAISFGRPYISNPDLAERIRLGAEWAPNIGVPQSWYLPGPVGYIDYPAMAEAAA
jgi:2,4-dienoyl-CoA reductase-like NADH-dependent reductase (Old Yellow Enzyme family)